MCSAIAPVRIPMMTELRHRTTTNNPDATERDGKARQDQESPASPPERRHNPQKPKKPECHLRESLYFLTDRLSGRDQAETIMKAGPRQTQQQQQGDGEEETADYGTGRHEPWIVSLSWDSRQDTHYAWQRPSA
jgi:hypothetical protein